jgi:hypothetical protein
VTALIHGAKFGLHDAPLHGCDRLSGLGLFSLPRLFLLLTNQLV